MPRMIEGSEELHSTWAKWAKYVTKVPDAEDKMHLEMSHLRVGTLPTLHILGTYLECKPLVEEAVQIQVRLEKKIE